jgi:hypothetical protein
LFKEYRLQVVRGLRGMRIWEEKSSNSQSLYTTDMSENLYMQGKHALFKTNTVTRESQTPRVTYSGQGVGIPESV